MLYSLNHEAFKKNSYTSCIPSFDTHMGVYMSTCNLAYHDLVKIFLVELSSFLPKNSYVRIKKIYTEFFLLSPPFDA